MFVHFILVTANLIIYLCIKITSTLPATEVSVVNHILVSDEKDKLLGKSAPFCFHWIRHFASSMDNYNTKVSIY